MGVSLSWLAVEGAKSADLYAGLGLVEHEGRGDYYDYHIAGGRLPGWLLVTAKGCESPLVAERILEIVSAGRSAVACSIEEHVMYQAAEHWHDGRQTWKVVHRGGDYGILDLVVSGAPPHGFEAIRAAAFARQAADTGARLKVDYIADVPLDLAKAITSFKHDEMHPMHGMTGFTELRLLPGGLLLPSRRRWWSW